LQICFSEVELREVKGYLHWQCCREIDPTMTVSAFYLVSLGDITTNQICVVSRKDDKESQCCGHFRAFLPQALAM
jgi:hypothetical protein